MRSLSGFRAGSTRSLIVSEICAEDHDLVRAPNFGPCRTGCAHRTLQGQKFIAVTTRQLSGPHGKLMQMPGEARVEETGTEAEAYSIIVRSFRPVADLDDRLQRIFTVLSLPPLEELSAQGPCITRATRVTSDLAEPPLGMGFGDRCGDSEGDSGVSEEGDA
jgi:hypothetical protein